MAYKIYSKLNNVNIIDIIFDSFAYSKMLSYIAECDMEIAWNGFIERRSDTEFFVSDVFLFPQIRNSVTVTTNEVEYAKWFAKFLDTPEKIKLNRMIFHSHVNMGVSPSSVDRNYWKQVCSLLEPETDSFLLFGVINKRHQYHFELHDYKNMIVWETADMNIKISKGNSKEMIFNKNDIRKEIEDSVSETIKHTSNISTYTTTPTTTYNFEKRYDDKGYAGEQVAYNFDPSHKPLLCDSCFHTLSLKSSHENCRNARLELGYPQCYGKYDESSEDF